MKTESAKLFNCGNDFCSSFFKKLCTELENREHIHAYVDCIGHTRNNTVQEIYKEKLLEKYGNELEFVCSKGEFSYSYYYKLRQPV